MLAKTSGPQLRVYSAKGGGITPVAHGADLTAGALKTIAILCMLVDHTVTAFLPWGSPEAALLHIPGRVVAPIMCFFIAEGFHHTHNLRRYLLRLLVFAVLSHFPYVLVFGLSWWKATSVMWGLALGLLALATAKTATLSPAVRVAIISLCCVLALPADWGYVTVVWVLCFGLFRGQPQLQMVSFVCSGFLLAAIPAVLEGGIVMSYEFAIILAVPLLLTYHGRLGKKRSRWGFYIFYPAHLLALYLLRLALQTA